eukprot:gene7177-7391_t
MSMEACQAAVEHACLQFQDPATQAQAEQVLLQFRRSPGVLAACRHILEHSASCEARFHAACALREGLLREWASHTDAERQALRTYLLQYVLVHAAEPQLQVVCSILQGTLAVMLKRGWVDLAPEGRAAFFQELASSSTAFGSSAAQVASLQVLESVVSEFSLVTASQLGLSWEFHETCRNQLEEQFLRQIFEHGLQVAQQAAEAVAAAVPGSAETAAAAMKLMTAVLAWDFKATSGSSSFVTACAALTAAVGPAAGQQLAQSARQLVVAFCCLAGDVFPRPTVTSAATAADPAAAPATVAHVAQMLRLCGYAMAALPPPAAALESASRTAAAVVEAALADAAAGAHEDADEDEDAGAGAVHQEEWLARVAVLLRANLVASANQLSELLKSKQHALAAAAAAGSDTSELLEQLYWLVRMAAHTLADSGVGEVPLPPEAVLMAPAAAAVVSPRLLEACVWGAARWADTYLFPEDEEPLPEALENVFGEESGAHILDMLVHVVQHCLAAYPGEVELHRQVCQGLLPRLVHRKPLCRRLLHLPSWSTLAAAFSRREAALSSHLAQKFQRALSRSLCLAAAGYAEQSQAQQYVSHLLLQTANEVAGLAGQQHQQLVAAAQRADVQLQVCCLLEVLRGAAAAALPTTQPALSSMFLSLLVPLLTLHNAFKHVSPVVALLLKLADDIVDHLAVVMESQQHKEQVLNWTLQLLMQYRDSNLWQVSLQTARLLKEDRAAEQCRDLRAVLNLLIHITQADLSADEEEEERRAAAAKATNGTLPAEGAAVGDNSCSVIARVVLVGLNIVLPLINAELLKFPKLAQLYFSLLSYMLEVYPRAVAELPSEHFGSLMVSLEWGLLGSDVVAAHCSLEGLTGLARYQLQAVQTGAPGLSLQSAVSAALAQLGSWLQGHADQLAAVPADGASSSAVMRAGAREFRQQLSRLVADVRGLVRIR